MIVYLKPIGRLIRELATVFQAVLGELYGKQFTLIFLVLCSEIGYHQRAVLDAYRPPPIPPFVLQSPT